ncbi:MAG: PAS domain S-box protein, partial [Methanoregulaceae archaeon]|nr:PAS domain S-box protein [Methanoregulaceae archaeon]
RSINSQEKQGLDQQARAEEILSGISLQLISTPPHKSQDLYPQILEKVGSFMGGDRVSLVFLEPGGTKLSRVYEWSRRPETGIAGYLEGTSLDGFPWLFPRLLNSETVIVQNVGKLPDEAKGIRQYWKNLGVKQALVLPLVIEKELVGALFVEHRRSRKKWAMAFLPLLQTLAALFAAIEARIRDEENLRMSEEKFRTLFENFLNPVFIAGDDGRFTDANVVALDFMEEGMDDVTAKKLTDWIPGLASILAGAPKDKVTRPRLVETEYTTHGRTKTMLFNVVPFPVRGRILYYGFGQDITERKQAEREIADARLFAEGILRAVPLSVIVVTSDGRVAFANPSFYHTFSLRPEEVEHLPLPDIPGGMFNPPHLMGNISVLFATAKRIRRFAWEYRSPEGVQKFLELDAQLIQRRAPFGPMAALVISDVTEQKRLDLAIRKSEERFKSLFQESPIPLWEEDFSGVQKFISQLKESGVSDLRRHFTDNPADLRKAVRMVRVKDVNQATLDLHEAGSKEEFLGGISAIFTPESHAVFCEEFLALDAGGRVFESEIRTQTQRSGERVLIIRLSLVEGSEASWERVIVSLLDITDRKKVEEELQKGKDLFQYIASFTQENPSPILEVRDDGSVSFANLAAILALRRRGMEEDPVLFFPRDMDGILEELRKGNGGFFYRTVTIGESLFGESLYLSPEKRTVRLYAQEITGPRKEGAK